MKDRPSNKQRTKKVSRQQTLARRRQLDRARRERRRMRQRNQERERIRRQFKFRRKVMKRYRWLRQQISEKEAVQQVLAEYAPTEPWHQQLSASTIRRWHRAVVRQGWLALRPQSTRPKTIHYQIPDHLVFTVVMMRLILGWGGERISAECEARGLGKVSSTTIYKIFSRYGLPVKTYALKAKSAGIAYRRVEKKRPNQLWHIDLKQTNLRDGTKVYICIIIDAYSRFCLAAVAGTNKTSAWVAQVTQEAVRFFGPPEAMLSDNGREFVSVWEESLTQFGHLLKMEGIEHKTTAPYYPQTNGKAEAFIKTMTRECLTGRIFDSLEELQAALDKWTTWYNNYRRHSSLGWQTPVSRFAGITPQVQGLAALPGMEAVSHQLSAFMPSQADPPVGRKRLARGFRCALVPVSYFDLC